MKLYLTEWVVNTLNKKAKAEYHSCINQEQYRKWQAKWYKHLKQESYCITKPITNSSNASREQARMNRFASYIINSNRKLFNMRI